MIEVERQNGINNLQGADRQNKTYKELLIANYPIREIHNIGIEQNQIDESYTNFILQSETTSIYGRTSLFIEITLCSNCVELPTCSKSNTKIN